MQRYNISSEQPLNHWLSISLKISDNSSKHLNLSLAGWRPGRYEMAEYASYIRNVKAFDKDGEDLSINKSDKNTWEIDHTPEELEIKYEFYAAQPDGGGSWLTPELIYLNFINFAFRVSGLEEEEIEVHLNIPVSFKIATSLKVTDKRLIAKNYYELIDSPLFASEKISFSEYYVDETKFKIAFCGENSNPENWKNDFEKFTREHLDLFGEFPFKEYTFLILGLPFQAYHGVEHNVSTIIILGPEKEIESTKYNDLLGVSSHELFHAWNVCRIRPVEMMPYDLSKENYHKTGYITEGFTTYYGDKILATSDVFSTEQFLEEINKMCKRHFQNEGRKHSSLSDSSFDLWVDGYRNRAPGRKVSIYVKGCLSALALDLLILRNTKGEKSLDNAVRELWRAFGKTSLGYSENDILQILNNVNAKNVSQEFYTLYHQTIPIENILNPLLSHVGCKLKQQHSQLLNERKFGFRLSPDNSGKIIAIAPGSPAESQLMIGDKIISIENKSKDLAEYLSSDKDQDSLTLKYERFGIEYETSLTSDGKTYYDWYKIEKNDSVSKDQKEMFKKWLKKEF
ncbi:M61 family metallopeptidase [Mangrovivirga cuniculi]|nr:M61 family metallopeptidase [Mangrovivirga cuniculi]